MTVLHRAPGEPHADQFHDTGGRCAVVEIPTAWIDRFCGAPMIRETAEYQGGPLASIAVRLYDEFRIRDDAATLAISGLVLEMLAGACRARARTVNTASVAWLARCREMLHARFRERIFLDEIAREVKIHPSHLARVFRRAHRCTLGEYVRRLRIEFACRQLAGSTTALLDIALDAGFSDQSHFCRAFKRQIGLTPTEFRRMTHSR
jgi:AraC family transcriptional regulator